MQSLEVPHYAGDQQQGLNGGHEEHGDEGHKKKSVLGKMKDKAKKLKTKMSPRSHGDTGENNDESSSLSSSEDESGSEPHQQQLGRKTGEEKDVVATPGPKGEAFEAIPDPHVDTTDRFGQLKLGDEPESINLQEEVPSAPGHVSAGVTASHNLGSQGIPVEEGKNTEGKDLLVTPTESELKGTTPIDYEQPLDVSKTSDNTATDEQKSLKDRVVEGATAASGDGALGLKSATDSENVSGSPKSMLQQAKEKMFGSQKKDETVEIGENKPTITGRATDMGTGIKDTIASKLGYGSNKNLTSEGDVPATPDTVTDTMEVDAQIPDNKSVLQKIQERAADAAGAVTSKLGYGEKKSPFDAVGVEVNPGDNVEVNPGDNKSYTQKAYAAAFGAKDAVAAKLGYGGTSPKNDMASETQGDGKSYLQKVQETAEDAKGAVASKLGYANRDVPTAGASEGVYGDDEQNVPASTAVRFHPGEEDRALSQLITEKMSTGAVTVKDTLLRPFGASKSAPPTPTTTPPPSSAGAVEADPLHTTVRGTTTDVPQDERRGIVGKVTDAVSSLYTSASGKKKAADEASGKANEDPQAGAGVEVQ